jgi:hypothetical protein
LEQTSTHEAALAKIHSEFEEEKKQWEEDLKLSKSKFA